LSLKPILFEKTFGEKSLPICYNSINLILFLMEQKDSFCYGIINPGHYAGINDYSSSFSLSDPVD